MLPTLRITRADIDADGFYIGETDVSEKPFPGHIEIASNLGTVRFRFSVQASGRIVALAGSGIVADWNISAGSNIIADRDVTAGEGITAGSNIIAGDGIKAGRNISAGGGIKAGSGIKAGDGIEAGWDIKAGEGITAGSCILAGWGISAGEGITAGDGILVGLTIVAKWVSARLRIFAGLCAWKIPAQAEMEISAEIRSGTVAFGVVSHGRTLVPAEDLAQQPPRSMACRRL